MLRMNPWLIVRVALVLSAFLRTTFARGVVPMEEVDHFPPLLILVFAFVGMLFIVGIQRLNPYTSRWRYPSWRINPFMFREPLQFFHLGGFFFLASAAGMLVNGAVTGRAVSTGTFVFLAFGVGILGGVHACTVLHRGKMVAR